MAALFPWSTLHQRLRQRLTSDALLPRGASLLLAVSGGQDSLCLTQLLVDLQPKWQWQLQIAHCDHRWPGDEGIRDHVAQWARTWGLAFHGAMAPDHLPPHREAPARAWRYEALTVIAQGLGCTHVVTGHTLSDRAETLLYNLCRGSGMAGLGCLPWSRSLAPGILLVRPLLAIQRQETAIFCQQRGLAIWNDAANSDPRHRRNRLRQEIFPRLHQEINAQSALHCAQAAEILAAEQTYLADQSRRVWEEVRCDRDLHRPGLAAQPLALQRRVLALHWQAHLPTAPSFVQIENLRSLILAPQGSRSPSLPGGWYVIVVGAHLRWLQT